MKLEELLDIETLKLNSTHIENYIDKKGLGKVKKKELDKIIERHGIRVLHFTNFSSVYEIISADDTNRTMKMWTQAMGIMTFMILIMTFVILKYTIK